MYPNISYNEFDEYFEVVLDNVSDSILTDEIWNQHFSSIQELIHDLHYIQIPPAKAVRIIESVFSNFGNKLIQGNDYKLAEKYIKNEYYNG